MLESILGTPSDVVKRICMSQDGKGQGKEKEEEEVEEDEEEFISI